MAPEQYAQEFECSFESALIGSYYGSYLETAASEQRITRVPWEPSSLSILPLIWASLTRRPSGLSRLWAACSTVLTISKPATTGLEWYAKVIKEKPYTLGRVYWPHDIEARDFSSDGRTRLAIAESLGLRPSVVVPRGDIADGIAQVRTMFPRFLFDQEKCYEGLEALKAYRREWNETRKDWVDHPGMIVRHMLPTACAPLRWATPRARPCSGRPAPRPAALAGHDAREALMPEPDYARIAYEAYAAVTPGWRNGGAGGLAGPARLTSSKPGKPRLMQPLTPRYQAMRHGACGARYQQLRPCILTARRSAAHASQARRCTQQHRRPLNRADARRSARLFEPAAGTEPACRRAAVCCWCWQSAQCGRQHGPYVPEGER